MDKVSGRLLICFEAPFWVGIFEHVEDGKLAVSKVTFGAEPKDFQVLELLLAEYDRLEFSPEITVDSRECTRMNPKRLQRLVRKQTEETGIGTKSQQALKLQQNERKNKQKRESKARKEEVLQQRFEQKQLQKKEKHRGH